ncbi:DUF2254 domain-containing protein [Frigidibacter sp. MR17.24]|uniref:DUF2254 domain-containing protein n=1 Tax=Frigidibacter sp. MR17.24 TaxID=3127345 RepID=UPI003012EC03
MSSAWLWKLWRVTRGLWVRAALFGLAAIAAALLGLALAPWLPEDLGAEVGADSLDEILSILASSMLAVTTFSLSTMVSAYSGATSNVTPRAVQLLLEDRTSQTALSTFLGAFIFALVGMIVLQTGLYGLRGRVVLYGVTLALIVLIVVTMIRWIQHLSQFGRVASTTARVEEATARALDARACDPALGGQALAPGTAVPRAARAVLSAQTGYVQHVDLAALQAAAEEAGIEIWLDAMPGALVHPAQPLLHLVPGGPVTGALPEARLRAAFAIDARRGFEHDPRFGLAVMAEIASRALSPAVNDPGTAIDVLGRLLRLFADWSAPRPPAAVRYPRVRVPLLSVADMFDDAFAPIARDGAAMVEVQIRLQKTLAALSAIAPPRFAAPARAMSADALARGEALALPGERARVAAAAPAAEGAGDRPGPDDRA